MRRPKCKQKILKNTVYKRQPGVIVRLQQYAHIAKMYSVSLPFTPSKSGFLYASLETGSSVALLGNLIAGTNKASVNTTGVTRYNTVLFCPANTEVTLTISQGTNYQPVYKFIEISE